MIKLLMLPLMLILGALFGILLGNIYFVGLWLTVRKLPQVRAPMLLAMGSFISRLAIVLVGLSLLLLLAKDYLPLPLLTCLLMFFWVRNHTINKYQLKV